MTGAATFASTVTATGQFLAAQGTQANPAYSFVDDPSSGIMGVGIDGIHRWIALGSQAYQVHGLAQTFLLGRDWAFGWSPTTDLGSAPDVLLYRDGVGILAQRNGTAPQEFRLYGTTTGAKYLSFAHDGSSAFLNANNVNLYLEAGGVGWGIEVSSGTLFPTAAGSIDIGFSSDRVRSIYLGGNTPAASAPMIDCSQTWNDAGQAFIGAKISIIPTLYAIGSMAFGIYGGVAGTTELFTVDPTGYGAFTAGVQGGEWRFLSNGRLWAPSDGVVAMSTNGGGDFGRLCFGGLTSSFPAWKRVSSYFQARLADDSGFTAVCGTAFLDANTIQVVGTQGAAVADATGAGDVVAQLNTLLARLRTHGLIAT